MKTPWEFRGQGHPGTAEGKTGEVRDKEVRGAARHIASQAAWRQQGRASRWRQEPRAGGIEGSPLSASYGSDVEPILTSGDLPGDAQGLTGRGWDAEPGLVIKTPGNSGARPPWNG